MAGPFQFETYHNPYVQSISQLMLAPAQAQAQAAQTIGQAQANAALARGQAWSGAAQNIGQSVGQVAQQMGDPRRIEEQQRQRDLQALDKAFTMPGGRDSILNALPGHLRPTVQKQFQEADTAAANVQESQLKAENATTSYVQTLAEIVKAHDYDPVAMQLNITHAKDTFKNNPSLLNQVTQFETVLHQNPTQDTVRGIVDPILKAKDAQEKPVILPATPRGGSPAQLVRPSGGAPIAVGEPAPVQPVEHVINGQLIVGGKPVGPPIPKQVDPLEESLKQAQLAEINAKLNGTVPLSQKDRAELQIQRERLAMEQKNNEAAPTLTPDALNLTAKMYAMTGQLPPMGLGKTGAAVRASIINKAADEYKSLDLPQQIAAYKANQQSLTKVQGTADKVSAFENTAGKNLDQFLSLAEKIPDTGSPWVNQPIRSLDVKALGSTDLAAANAAREVALREIARVTNDPNLSGSLTDSARKEIQGLSPESATFAQIKAVAKVLRQDMANVHSGLNEQIADIQRRIATPPGQAIQPPAPAALVPTMRYNPATGKVEPIVKP